MKTQGPRDNAPDKGASVLRSMLLNTVLNLQNYSKKLLTGKTGPFRNVTLTHPTVPSSRSDYAAQCTQQTMLITRGIK